MNFWISIFVSLLISVPEAIALPKIAMFFPLSGQFSAIGSDCRQGLEVAKLEIDHSRFEFLVVDTKNEPMHSITEFKKSLTVDKISAAFAFRGPVGMALNPFARDAKISLLGGVGNTDFTAESDYSFQLWPRSDKEGQFLSNQIVTSGIKKVAIVTTQDDWTLSVSSGFKESFVALGGKIVEDQELLPTEFDFRSTVVQLRNSNPEAIFLNVTLNQIAPLVKQIRDLGINAKIYSNFWAGKKEVIAAAGSAIENVFFWELSTDLDNLKQELNSRFNSTPSGATLSVYVGSILLAQAMGTAKDHTPAALYQALLAQKEVRTKNGIFPIENRTVQFPMTLKVVRKATVQTP